MMYQSVSGVFCHNSAKRILYAALICWVLSPSVLVAQVTGFTLMDSASTGVNFINRCVETPERCIYQYDYFYNGGGVAIADFNNDQLPDIFFTGNDEANRLYFNKGNFQFIDVSASAGISNDKWYTGVTVTDINNDGWNDLYVCCSGPDFLKSSTANELYVNNRNGTFTEKAAEYGIADKGLSTHAVFFDMDKDGDEDLWVLNHGVRNMAKGDLEWLQKIKMVSKDEYLRYCNTLYRNDNGHFTDISVTAGISEAGFGLGIAISDFNRDGLPDVYICNDYFVPDRYYLNLGNGRFSDQVKDLIPHVSYFSMGCDAADINNDGWTDLSVLDMTPADHYRNKMLMNAMAVNEFRYLTDHLEYVPQYMFNTLQINNGLGLMGDIGQLAGVHQSDWSWAPLLADLNNDGLKDLYITNGYKRDVKNNDWRVELMQKMNLPGFNEQVYFEHLQKADITPIPNQIYQNRDGYQFLSRTEEWNHNTTSFSNGAAYGDLDLDGDLDMVVNNLDSPAFLLQNNISSVAKNHFMRFELVSRDTSFSLSNASVALWFGGRIQRAENLFNRGFQSYVEPVIHFGLGEVTAVDSVLIDWGNGQITRLMQPVSDRVHRVQYDHTEHADRTPPAETRFFTSGIQFSNESKKAIQPEFFHEENAFDDFAKEVLLPHRMSTPGPGLAVGDVNNDGLEDFFIGNGKGKAPALYLQNEKGGFEQTNQNLPAKTKHSETAGATFFHANGDQFLDLYIATGGGGEFSINDSLLQDELLINDGHGVFAHDKKALPVSLQSTRVVKACDYDNDGDEDLFVGARNVPGAYPLSPRSLLLKNTGGKFEEDTHWAQQLSSCGMVTDATWLDWEGDADMDLVVVGEWTAVQVYLNDKGTFSKPNDPQLEQLTGWWSSIGTGDFDEDGDIDILLGNLGWNNKFHPSAEKPLEVYANDFDDNGTLDIVLGKHYKDQVVPVRGRECSSAQMPFLAKRFPTFDSFASSTLEKIYSPEQLKSAYHLQVKTFSSMYLKNNGGGKYTASDLPVQCQVAPINSFVVQDFDGDQHLDVVIGGNNLQSEVETIPYDAGKGILMKGVGDGTFYVYNSIEETGIFMPGDVKSIVPVSLTKENKRGLLVARNSGKLHLFGVK